MRRFPVFAPKLIAKHARILVNGVIWVKHLGWLRFKQGRFLAKAADPIKVKEAVKLLNQEMQTSQVNA
ncbi:DUF1107 family protein [Paraferrimonas sedimenticola]|uniref:DUF1107 domain-containing protein n=1 Tax=Paraferrimonas sedimenticola TaxID=375674 RepID=A0AA37RYD7_9GAMM|nr:DUF1107 family protein [Paraferrimonas sedimenticola]GLP97581.1 hypothetical protein GCM10007895_28880 [Paraferrimonas sedimenticola]